MKKYYLLCLLFFSSFFSSPLTAAPSRAPLSGWQEEVAELNQKIALIRRWQEGYKMTADQARFKGDRLQFQEDNLIDSKRLWQVAENADQKVQDLQVILDRLILRRNAILEKHRQPIPKT